MDSSSPERSQCYSEGEFSVVNVTYDNYLALVVGGDFTVTGRVVVCQDGVYGSVCDVDWDQEDANAICNTIGPTSAVDYGKQYYSKHSEVWDKNEGRRGRGERGGEGERERV